MSRVVRGEKPCHLARTADRLIITSGENHLSQAGNRATSGVSDLQLQTPVANLRSDLGNHVTSSSSFSKNESSDQNRYKIGREIGLLQTLCRCGERQSSLWFQD
ncbi:hypothetical protein Bbelb_338430 [Branchiostoma belcheri]|nr:hypothetical protein Bbelb_338430 [Branchiostoma belcheri]